MDLSITTQTPTAGTKADSEAKFSYEDYKHVVALRRAHHKGDEVLIMAQWLRKPEYWDKVSYKSFVDNVSERVRVVGSCSEKQVLGLRKMFYSIVITPWKKEDPIVRKNNVQMPQLFPSKQEVYIN